jgi:hypothetical protein
MRLRLPVSFQHVLWLFAFLVKKLFCSERLKEKHWRSVPAVLIAAAALQVDHLM